jgi:microcystin-dependent protein
MIVVDTTAGNVTLTLPLISSLTLPVVIGVKKRTGDANTVTITRSGTNTIDAVTSKVISVQGASVSLIPNISGDWATVDASLPSSGGGQQSIYFCGVVTTSYNTSPGGYVWNVTEGEANKITSLYDGLTVKIKIDQTTNYPTYLKINNLELAEIRLNNGNGTLFNVISNFSTNAIYTLTLLISPGGIKTWKIDESFCAGGTSIRMASFAVISDSVSTSLNISGTATVFGGVMQVSGFSGNVTAINTSGIRSGAKVTFFFSASGTFVHSTALQLPLSQNLTVQSGDILSFRKIDNNWQWESYSRADGQSLLQSYEAGKIEYFAGNTAPLGFLKANGAAISRTTYSRLFAYMGTTFGTGDGSTTFNLPDMRGEFVRGWDDGRGIDIGRTFGSWQVDDFKSHTHGQTFTSTAPYNVGSNGNGAFGSTGATGGVETRPRNIALLACIKY